MKFSEAKQRVENALRIYAGVDALAEIPSPFTRKQADEELSELDVTFNELMQVGAIEFLPCDPDSFSVCPYSWKDYLEGDPKEIRIALEKRVKKLNHWIKLLDGHFC